MSLRRNLVDLLHGFALPCIAFVLPWRIAFGLYRALAHLPLYAFRVAPLLAGIRRVRTVDADAARALAWRHRLYLLLESADAALVPQRSGEWFRSQLKQKGAFPANQQFVAIFFHFGTGFPGLRMLAAEGLRPRLVLRPIDDAGLERRPYVKRHALWRVHGAERVCAAPIIFTGGASGLIAAAIANGETIVGSVDIPPTETHNLSPVNLLGHATAMPHGLAALAAEAALPLVVYSVALSADARERIFEIGEPIQTAGRPLQEVMQEVADALDERLARDPAGWQFWGWLDAFFPIGTFENTQSVRPAEVERSAGSVRTASSEPPPEFPMD